MKKAKRIGALILVILWGIMIIATLVTAFIPDPDINNLFKGLLITDIMLPIVIYAMMLVYRILNKRGSK